MPRLGIPAYNWWQEALHGVASGHGVKFQKSGNFSVATSFPQPILLGATFDDALVKDIATLIGTEARAFSNNDRSGMDFWTPNINPFKDPRWGRGQEVPGEDPFHLSSYVRALIEGLEGPQSQKYKKLIATCKHFAAYDLENWNNTARHEFDAKVSLQDLVEYYLPPFRECARDSKVGAFMCAYNAINGVPACADEYLLQTVLREHWNWTREDQWITGDCGAIENVFKPHDYAKTPPEAVAKSINAGTDLDCGSYYQAYLAEAQEKGLVKHEALDRALVRLYSSLIKAGYFDPGNSQPYRSLGVEDVNTHDAQQLAYRAAGEGVTLLKNDGILPVGISGKSIAIIGDWANATSQMQGNYFGVAPYLHSPLHAAQSLNVTALYNRGVFGKDNEEMEDWDIIQNLTEKVQLIFFIGGIDGGTEDENRDRNQITWSKAQLVSS